MVAVEIRGAAKFVKTVQIVSLNPFGKSLERMLHPEGVKTRLLAACAKKRAKPLFTPLSLPCQRKSKRENRSQMNRLLLVASTVLLNAWPQVPQSQSQAEPYGFQDLRLGMSIAEFRTNHRAPKVEKYGRSGSSLPGEASCTGRTVGDQKNDQEEAARGIVRCGYTETYLSVPLRVSVMFLDGKLAVIEVEPPADNEGCLNLSRPARQIQHEFSMRHLASNIPFYGNLSRGKLGSAIPLVSTNESAKNFDVRRWENDSSVAEFQDHMCGPWNGTDEGWSKAISEILEGTYCGRGDSLSFRQTVMFYLHRELSHTLETRLAKTTN